MKVSYKARIIPGMDYDDNVQHLSEIGLFPTINNMTIRIHLPRNDSE